MTTDTAPLVSPWGHFTANPRVELLDDGRRVRICEAFCYVARDGTTYTVPAGFTCDGASIPRLLWPLSGGPFEGRHRDAALVHDRLYCAGRDGNAICARATADRVFYEAMRCCGVPWWSAALKYLAVRAFGPRW